MGSGKKETGRGRMPDRDAVEWFVQNESDHELDEATVLQWEAWCADPRNVETYIRILEVRRQISMLPKPSPQSREELRKDALPEHGFDVIVGKKSLS
jgi:ferric-dicitrate binding protein FerR (iron transport regulator)